MIEFYFDSQFGMMLYLVNCDPFLLHWRDVQEDCDEDPLH